MKWPMDKIFVKTGKRRRQEHLQEWCAAGETYQRKCATGKIFLTES